MTLSRTARILIAVLLLAAAAFFWVNFFSQEQPSSAPTTAAAPATSPTTTATAPSTPKTTPSGTAANGSTSAPAAGSTTTAAPASPSGASGTVVAPSRPAVATRDLQVAELPFLVTEPPATGSAASSSGTAATGSTAGGAQQTASAQRMTVNPFSPIVVQAAAAPAPQPAPQPPASQQVTPAAAPAETAPPKLAEAPAPQPVAPPPPQASGLPRALPSGMLPTTPGVLQSTRAQATSAAPKDLGSVAAVQVPENGTSSAGGLAAVSQSGTLAGGPSVPNVLGPGQATQASSNPSNPGNGNAPLQAGNDSLSRYLRDNNVRFTGTVLGPVSVGVFRSDQYKTPVVVPLGQDLPDTKITLTDLRGHEAVFTLNDATQSLSLDLRR